MASLHARAMAAGYPEMPFVNVDQLYALVCPNNKRKSGVTWEEIDSETTQKMHKKALELLNSHDKQVKQWKQDHPELAKELHDSDPLFS